MDDIDAAQAGEIRSRPGAYYVMKATEDTGEILLYSDGSDDDTNAVAAAIAARDPRVKLLISEMRGGKPKGVNRMLEVATGGVRGLPQ